MHGWEEITLWAPLAAWGVITMLLGAIWWFLKQAVYLWRSYLEEIRSDMRRLHERQEQADKERVEMRRDIDNARQMELQQLMTVDAKIDGLRTEIANLTNMMRK